MKSFILVLSILISFQSYSQSTNEFVDFKKIKKILKQDGLEKSAQKKLEEKQKREEMKQRAEVKKFDLPTEEQFWPFVSEYWLVKNAPILKWDIKKPDYGVVEAFQKFLKKFGFYEVKFHIIYADTPNLTHTYLPYSKDHHLFVLSIPFIRTMDLSKTDICLLLFEDFLRSRNRYIENRVKTKKLVEMFGSNFHGKKFDKKIIENLLKGYDNFIWEKGFEIKEQYEVTKTMDKYLRNDLKMWNRYLKLLERINSLIKGNLLYNNYVNIYPTPSLQIKWLVPAEKVL